MDGLSSLGISPDYTIGGCDLPIDGQAPSFGVQILDGLRADYDVGIENLENRFGLAQNLNRATPEKDAENLTRRINAYKPQQGWSPREAMLLDLAYMLGVVRLTQSEMEFAAEQGPKDKAEETL